MARRRGTVERGSGRARALLLGLLLAACSCGEPPGQGEGLLPAGVAQGYNLLLISLDTTRADRLGCYGYADAETPHLDALALQGIRFDTAMTSAPVTLPSHTSILTGLDPPHHGVRDNVEFRLAPEHETLAERLGPEGYETAAFVSAFVLDSRYGLDQGFQLYDDSVGDDVGALYLERTAEELTSAAVAWLNGRNTERPFFAWVHYFSPHIPYAPPPPYDERFAERPYDGEIAYMDSQIGVLLAALRQAGEWERTLIVVVGDHGEGLGDHDEPTHAMLIYDSVMRVPLILACPGRLVGPQQTDRLVSVTDLVPTLLDLLGVARGETFDGISLAGVEEPGERVVYIESAAPYLQNGWSPLFGLRRAADKYILAPRSEYYDLALDPDETDNLFDTATAAQASARDDLVLELERRLARWPALSEVIEETEPIDAATARRLEALGYVGGRPWDEPPSLADPKEMMEVLELVNRAALLLRARRLDEALETAQAAYRQSPRDRRVLQTLGLVQLYTGNEAEAERAFRAYLEIRPSADICALLAQILIRGNRDAEAHALLDQAEQLDPEHGVTYLARGDLLVREGRLELAIAQYERAAQADPTLTRAAERGVAALRERLYATSPAD